MNELFASGHIVDIVLVLTISEGVTLAAYHRWTGRGLSGRKAFVMLLPGACLMMAVREALVGAAWMWVALALLAALFAHLADLRGRCRGAAPGSPWELRRKRRLRGQTAANSNESNRLPLNSLHC